MKPRSDVDILTAEYFTADVLDILLPLILPCQSWTR